MIINCFHPVVGDNMIHVPLLGELGLYGFAHYDVLSSTIKNTFFVWGNNFIDVVALNCLIHRPNGRDSKLIALTSLLFVFMFSETIIYSY